MAAATAHIPTHIESIINKPVSACESDYEPIDISFTDPIYFDPYSELLHELYNFLTVENNWDGYGAARPDKSALLNAADFIMSLPLKIVNSLDKENITLTPYGTIVLEWENSESDDIISIEIGNDKLGYFSKFSDGETYYSNGIPFNLDSAYEILLPLFNKIF